MSAKYHVSDLHQLKEVAREIIDCIEMGSVVLLMGEMGAGKTTLAQAITRQLGVTDGFSSPTYSIVNHYEASDGEVYHIDLYRLESLEEALNIGIEDYLYPDYITLIEWPELIAELLPSTYYKIAIKHLEDQTREIYLEKVD